jgi:hypothetical protein
VRPTGVLPGRQRRSCGAASPTSWCGSPPSRYGSAIQIEVEAERFERLWPLTEGRRIEKTRYEIPASDGLVIELNVHTGDLEGLVVAEVEFDSKEAADAFVQPDRLGPRDRRRAAPRASASRAAARPNDARASQRAGLLLMVRGERCHALEHHSRERRDVWDEKISAGRVARDFYEEVMRKVVAQSSPTRSISAR